MVDNDPRTRRLRSDYEKLVELSSRSEFIDVEGLNAVPGVPFERYVVTFTCRGIAGIDSSRQPIYSDHHQVAIYLDAGYPRLPPHLKWMTPIWHPNIQHEEPFGVCINANTWWAPGRGLDQSVLMMGEMVQYKNYHPYETFPTRLDPEVADWVLWAEKQGIISQDHPVDDRELMRPQRIKEPSSASPSRIREVTDRPRPRIQVKESGPEAPSDPAPITRPGRVKLVS